MKPPTPTQLLLPLLLPLLHAQDDKLASLPAYVGPKICPGNVGVSGYTSTNILHYDMIHEAQAFTKLFDYLTEEQQKEEHVYILCPDTTFNFGTGFDAGDEQEVMPLTPLLSNTIIQCGADGLLSESCVLKGGLVQVHFFDFFITEYVFFEGLTFTDNKGVVVFAGGNSYSSATFQNCLIKDNKGYNGIQIYFDGNVNNRALSASSQYSEQIKELHIKKYNFKSDVDKSVYTSIISADESHRVKNKYDGADDIMEKREIFNDTRQGYGSYGEGRGLATYDRGMTVVLFATDVMDNVEEKGIVMNIAGTLEIIDSDISYNEAGFATIGTLLGGRISMHTNTVIENNFDKKGPVFVDRNSKLYLNKQVSGSTNYGSSCDIFMEDQGSNCVSIGKDCQGTCCDFGDETCATSVPASQGGGDLRSSASKQSEGGGLQCGLLCISLSCIIPVAVIGLAGVIIVNRLKKRPERSIIVADTQADTQSEIQATFDMEATLNEKAVQA